MKNVPHFEMSVHGISVCGCVNFVSSGGSSFISLRIDSRRRFFVSGTLNKTNTAPMNDVAANSSQKEPEGPFRSTR